MVYFSLPCLAYVEYAIPGKIFLNYNFVYCLLTRVQVVWRVTSIKHGIPIFTCNVLAEVTNSIRDSNIASFSAQMSFEPKQAFLCVYKLNMLLLFIDMVDFIPRESPGCEISSPYWE